MNFKNWLTKEESKIAPDDKDRRMQLAKKVEIVPPVYKSRVYTMKKK